MVDAPETSPIHTACPICAAGRTAFYCRKNGWRLLRCGDCGHGFVFPRPTLQDVTTENARETAESQLLAPTVASVTARRDVMDFVRRIDKLAMLRGRAIDIGAGDGAFSVAAAQFGFLPHMIDLDPRCGNACAAMPGSTFARETFEELQDRGPYALAIMSQVLEHALDPMDWLRRSAAVLMPGGMVAIALPNFGGIYRLLGKKDPYLIPPIHVNFFSPASMRTALESAGLEVVRTESDSHVGFRRGDGGIGYKRAVLATAMGVLSPVLDSRARGIILWAFARKPV